MTNRKMREMENRIRQAEEAPYDPSDERIEEIKQRAFEEYQRYTQAQEKANEKKEKRAQRKRSILRRVVVVAAVTVCFFVLSLVYIALQPSITANADSFFRRAVIWINDQLHLGIVITNPVETEGTLAPGDHRFYASIQELKSAGYRPIICLPENDNLIIDEIDLCQLSQVFQQVSIRYLTPQNETITIQLEPYGDINSIKVYPTSQMEFETSIGVFTIWANTQYTYALCITTECKVSIISTLSIEETENICKKLIKI